MGNSKKPAWTVRKNIVLNRPYGNGGVKPTWDIDVVLNCIHAEPYLKPDMCDAHTHGLDKFGSKELQVVLNLGQNVLGYILNSVGSMVRDGLVLEDGMTISGLFQDPVTDILVFETADNNDETIFRLVLPDPQYRFPEDSDTAPYNRQYESPYIEGRDCQCCESCTGLN